MSLDVALQGIDRFLSHLPPSLSSSPVEIRFGGAEPLLEWETIRQIFSRVRDSRVLFRLVTNGTRFTDEILSELRREKRLQLVLSLDGGEETHGSQRPPRVKGLGAEGFRLNPDLRALHRDFGRPVQVNMVVGPENAHRLYENAAFLYRAGARQINFLPAYYVPWTSGQIASLRSDFQKLSELIRRGMAKGILSRPANPTLPGPLPLFLTGFTVDWDGGIYPGDLIVSRVLKEIKSDFRVGHVSRPEEIDEARLEDPEPMIAAFIERLPPGRWAATRQVDEELTEFLHRISAP